MIDNSKEYIICAAYKRTPEACVTDSKIQNYKDPSLWDTRGKYDDVYSVWLGRRHNDILVQHRDDISEDSIYGGFYTSYGRYVDRKQALEIALACGQVTRENLTQGPTSKNLFSEDLY